MTHVLPSPTPEHHLRVVAGAWLRESCVLAALRPQGKSLGGYWELPGGKVEPGETDSVALARELAEELGVSVHVGPCFGEDLHARSEGGGLHLVAMVVEGAAEPLALEHDALQWVPLQAVGSVRWAEGDRRLLSLLLVHLGLDPALALEHPC